MATCHGRTETSSLGDLCLQALREAGGPMGLRDLASAMTAIIVRERWSRQRIAAAGLVGQRVYPGTASIVAERLVRAEAVRCVERQTYEIGGDHVEGRA